jgi:hypothetical protein
MDTFCSLQAGVSISRKQAAFEIHRNLACSDRGMTQLLLAYHFPNVDLKEYDVDVCAWMMSQPSLKASTGYADWLKAFPVWRQSGLFYPLALAATYMPDLHSWLPSEVHSSHVARAFAGCLQALRDPSLDHVSHLSSLAVAWASDNTGAAHILSGIMDRLAVLMGVKSNGNPHCPDGGFTLQHALDAFPTSLGDSMHESNFLWWHQARSAIEATFPPSLLCAPLVRPKRASWGHKQLTLEVACHPGQVNPVVVRFVEFELGVVYPSHGGATPMDCIHTYSPCHGKECLAQQTSFRVQDVIWRLGEIMLSPEVASCMMMAPRQAQSRVNPQVVLDAMCSLFVPFNSTPMEVNPGYLEKMALLDASIPAVLTYEFSQTQTAVMWRVDLPSRGIVYMGSGAEVNPAAESQHHLRKILVNSKSCNARHVGGIHSSQSRVDEGVLRGCIRTFASLELGDHPSNLILVKSEDENMGMGYCGEKLFSTPITSTTLAESLACFALCPPSRVTACPLGSSCSWKEGGIDPRYAEKQLGENGFRYRDWVAMHVGKGGTQQSRLASHAIEFDNIHATLIPWVDTENNNEVRWVRVMSSLPVDSRTIVGRTLRQGIESRFLHDLRMLPTPTLDGQTTNTKVERCNAELYVNGPNQVSIAYAPTGDTRLQFMYFDLQCP